MILGTQLYGMFNTQDLSIHDLIDSLYAHGIRRPEPCIRLFDMGDMNRCFWSVEQLEAAMEQIGSLPGMEVISCHFGTQDLLADLPQIINITEKYHIRQICFNTPEPYTREHLDAQAVIYTEAARQLAGHGKQLLIHNLGGEIAAKVDGMSAYEYFVRACQGLVGLQVDTGWVAFGGLDPVALLKRNKEYIKSVHLKDYADPGNIPRDTYIGGGDVDNLTCARLGIEWGLPVLIDQDTYGTYPEDLEKSLATVNGYNL